MVFSSIIFMFTFLPIMLAIYYISPKKIRNFILLLGSLIFYAWGEPVYIFLMILTSIVNFLFALLIDKYEGKKKKSIFVLSVSMNLIILGFFKYFGFFIDNLNNIFSLSINLKSLPLPIGISFYTFQTLSYIIDVYLDKVKVQKNIIDFSTYVTMFPQLVAGPIVRYSDIAEQLKKRKETLNEFGEGVEKFIRGLGKKILLANNIGLIASTIQSMDLSNLSVLTSWIGIATFTLQIYFDFSGYSDMAIGLGKMFGFKFIKNFDHPYVSQSVTEFWRRWHISLGSWFREYVYIPLGGNRTSLLKQCRNLFVVWGLTGLWHGASYNFIIWGLFYGIILMIEKFILKGRLKKIPAIFRVIYTMFIVMIGWVFFSMPTLSSALDYLGVMFFYGSNQIIDTTALYYLSTNLVLLILGIIFATPIPARMFNKLKRNKNYAGDVIALFSLIVVLLVSIAYLVNASYNPFIYFRF